MWTQEAGTHDTQDRGLTLLPPPGRRVPRRNSSTGEGGWAGALEAPQDRHGQEHRTGTSRAEQTTEAMAELEALEAMAVQGALEAMAVQGALEAMAVQGALEAMAVQGAQEAMAVQGAQEAMAVQGAQEAKAVQGAQEAMAVQGAQEACPRRVSVDKTDKMIKMFLWAQQDKHGTPGRDVWAGSTGLGSAAAGGLESAAIWRA